MPKEIITKEPISLPEVVTLFNKRKKDGELNYLQRIAFEHAQHSSKISSKKARVIIKKLTTEFELNEKIAINIVNFMPDNVDECRIFLQDASKVFSTEEIQKILEILKKEED